MSWLSWRPKSIGFSWTWRFDWPNVVRDKCRACDVERHLHAGKDHKFVEKKAS